MSNGISERTEGFTTLIGMLVRGRVSRAELQKATGFSRAFIMDLINSLRSANLIHVSGKGPDSAGRFVIEQFSMGPGPQNIAAPVVPKTVWVRSLHLEALKRIGQERAVPRRKALVSIPEAVSKVAATE